MYNPDRKLRVFISSKIGDNLEDVKYTLARTAIKKQLEATNLFRVYLFEDSSASTISAYNHYNMYLKDTDICLFLIDNKDGVPKGVQIEIDTANKYNIPSIYYFCDGDSQNKTATQVSLLTADSPKQRTIHSFGEFIEIGVNDVINDILLIYSAYSKNGLYNGNHSLYLDNSDDNSYIEEKKKGESVFVSHHILKGDSLINDASKHYLSAFLFGTENEIIRKTNLDYYSSLFLPVLFESESIERFNLSLFTGELKKVLPPDYYDIVNCRWESIQQYYLGNINESIRKLKEAYEIAKNKNVDDWFIQDILIDIRNQINISNESENKVLVNNFGQEELKKYESKVFYPIIDRNQANLLEWIEKDRQKNDTLSYSTQSIYGDLSFLSDSVANIFSQAMIFGSFTHLIGIYSYIQKIGFHLGTYTKNWKWFMLTLKNTVIELDLKKTHRITHHFEFLLEKMNPNDAREIYEYSNNRILNHQRFKANLIAMSEIGYYLSDEDFQEYWESLKERINKWVEDPDSIVQMGNPIFDCLNKIVERVSNDYLYKLSYQLINNGKKRYYDEAIKLLAKQVDISVLTQDKYDSLVEKLIKILQEEPLTQFGQRNFELLCLKMGKVKKSPLNQLEGALKKIIPEFYMNEYLVEIHEDIQGYQKMLQKQAVVINLQNREQGENGVYTFPSSSPYIISKNVIIEIKDKISIEVIDLIFNETTNTIINQNQLIDDKLEAYQLLIVICQYDSKVYTRNFDDVQRIYGIEDPTKGQESLLREIDKSLLSFAHSILLSCFGRDESQQILSLLSSFNDERSRVKACEIVKDYLIVQKNLQLSQDISNLLFQYSLAWNNSSSLIVRWHTVHILFYLSKVERFVPLICSQFVKLMNNDNAYIKSQLLHRIKQIKEIDSETSSYITELASIDNNYVVRKIINSIDSNY